MMKSLIAGRDQLSKARTTTNIERITKANALDTTMGCRSKGDEFEDLGRSRASRFRLWILFRVSNHA